jgi:CTP synthase
MNRSPKYIFFTGGVVSSLGKGLAAASTAALLEARGLTVTNMKMDPYLNVDPGTMSPYQHGEVFVTDDGAETDLDLGHYERFTHSRLSQANNITSGRVYWSVLERERRGDYLGKTIQVIPHITDEIKRRIRDTAHQSGADICIIEIGGTVGDIESLPFLEAIRQIRNEEGHQNTALVHLTLVPFIAAAGEMKTKPTQHSVKELLSIGLGCDFLLCRSEEALAEELKQKISAFCNVPPRAVISAYDVRCIYELPLVLNEQGLDAQICDALNIWTGAPRLEGWHSVVRRYLEPKNGEVTIGVVGKYVGLVESYKSLNEALAHAGMHHDVRLRIEYLDSEEIESDDAPLKAVDGVLVPGGFGERGSEGKISAIRYAREQKVPYFGICLGMQLAVVEHARHCSGLEGANSIELDPDTKHPVISLMEAQKEEANLGGTMRLGAFDCQVTQGTRTEAAYDEKMISERHRHRFEFNDAFRTQLEETGLVVAGIHQDSGLVEVVERADHPWFVGCQFHPEFKSRPGEPHPLFRDFIAASMSARSAQ